MTKPTKEEKLNIISWEVMGHEWSGMQQVMIGDVLDWWQGGTDDGWLENGYATKLAYSRSNYRKPIDEQPIETINFVYDLIVSYKNGKDNL